MPVRKWTDLVFKVSRQVRPVKSVFDSAIPVVARPIEPHGHAPNSPLSLVVLLDDRLVRSAPADTCSTALARCTSRLLLIDGHNDYPWALRETRSGARPGQARHPQAAAVDHDGHPPAEGRRRRRTVLVGLLAGRAPGPGGRHRHARADRHRPPDDRASIRRRSSWRSRPTTSSGFTSRARSRRSSAWRAATRSTTRSPTLRMFYRLGARYMTLTHTKNTPWADPHRHAEAQRPVAVRRAGRPRDELARACWWISATSRPTRWRMRSGSSQAPVIFSHSSRAR